MQILISIQTSSTKLTVLMFIEPGQVSWYTDRFVIGVTYNATELFWMGDTSDGRVHTWSFLERRLRETEQLRLGASNAYSRVMNFSDATFGTLATLVKSARRSY